MRSCGILPTEVSQALRLQAHDGVRCWCQRVFNISIDEVFPHTCGWPRSGSPRIPLEPPTTIVCAARSFRSPQESRCRSIKQPAQAAARRLDDL